MRIFLIAPDNPNLPNVQVEVAAIARQHECVKLVGEVRDTDIGTAIAKMRDDGFQPDIMWFVSHGNQSGILLSDGMISISGIVQYVSAASPRLCVLNTCASEDIATAIASDTHVDIICTIAEINDTDAMRTGRLLSSELVTNDNFEDAYNRVRPISGRYRYVRAGRITINRSAETDAAMRREMQELTKAMYELRATISADIRITNSQVALVQKQLDALERQQEAREQQTELMQQQIATMEQQIVAMRSFPARTSAEQTLPMSQTKLAAIIFFMFLASTAVAFVLARLIFR